MNCRCSLRAGFSAAAQYPSTSRTRLSNTGHGRRPPLFEIVEEHEAAVSKGLSYVGVGIGDRAANAAYLRFVRIPLLSDLIG
jgi:hypothetical protein